jgi:hypothetical protein
MPSVTAEVAAVLDSVARRRLAAGAVGWFAGAAEAGPAAFLEAFTVAGRRFGKGPVDLDGAERARLREAGVDWPLEGWGRDELGRIALIVAAAGRWSGPALVETLEAAYRQGDNRERQAVLRALPFLPDPEPFLPLAIEACRTHVQPVFEAIACENPYPARHFPEANFNQMVLKALFVGVPLDRVLGLARRVTPELVRMAADFASERRAAGRPVPPDIGRLAGARGSQP